jgi:hypothetical protein
MVLNYEPYIFLLILFYFISNPSKLKALAYFSCTVGSAAGAEFGISAEAFVPLSTAWLTTSSVVFSVTFSICI